MNEENRFCIYCGERMQEDSGLCANCGRAQSVVNEGCQPSGQNISRKEFREKYDSAFAKDIRNAAIVCYICAGITLLAAMGLYKNNFMLVDVALLLVPVP